MRSLFTPPPLSWLHAAVCESKKFAYLNRSAIVKNNRSSHLKIYLQIDNCVTLLELQVGPQRARQCSLLRRRGDQLPSGLHFACLSVDFTRPCFLEVARTFGHVCGAVKTGRTGRLRPHCPNMGALRKCQYAHMSCMMAFAVAFAPAERTEVTTLLAQ